MNSFIDKVLIVDDSMIFRKNIEKALLQIGDFDIVDSVFNGKKAIELIKSGVIPDIVTLDIEMPEMNGIETLREIQKINENRSKQDKICVLMVSSKTKAGADITIESLSIGAFDFIEKPNSDSNENNFEELKKALKNKFELYYEIKNKKIPKDQFSSDIKSPLPTKRKYNLISIGISTGGPKILLEMLPKISEISNLPIVVAQHMPAGFTKSLALHLNERCNHKVVEAKEGMVIEPKCIYIAPGGSHLLLKSNNDLIVCSINQNLVANGNYPSIDYLFRSTALIYKESLIALIMTGMGIDGTAGLSTVKRNGGYIIAQDEKSSTVWGMPKSAIENNLPDVVLGAGEIPIYLQNIIKE